MAHLNAPSSSSGYSGLPSAPSFSQLPIPSSMQAPRKSIGLESYSPVQNLELYKVINCIGQGSFGVIHRVQRKSDGMIFAIKQLDYSKMNAKDRRQMLAEVAILESLKHPHVVMLIDKILDKPEQKLYIVMEYCGGGDLGSVISAARRSSKPIAESVIWSYFLQLVLALHHCHWPEERANGNSVGDVEWLKLANEGGATSGDGGRGASMGAGRSMATGRVLHRDLKPENIFLDESQTKVKLGDFGLSKNLGGNKFTKTYVGTPLYMPPEILSESEYGTKSDIWSLGCLIYELCTLASPFAKAKTQSELKQMVSAKMIPPMPSYLSKELREAVKWMLTLEAEKRPSTTDLLNLDRMRLQKQILDLDIRADHVSAFKTKVEQREARLKVREREVSDREATLADRERQFEQETRVARTEYEAFWQAKTQFEAEKEHWQSERARERLSGGAHASSSAESSIAGWPRASVSGDSQQSDDSSRRASHVPRKSLIPTRLATEERSTIARQLDDTPSKIPSFAALSQDFGAQISLDGPSVRSTPLRSRLKTKSMNNIGARAREDAENSPPSPNPDISMHIGTPFRSAGDFSAPSPNPDVSMSAGTPIRPGPYSAASVSSPADMRRLALKSQMKASAALAEITGSSANERLPPTPLRARGSSHNPQQMLSGRAGAAGGKLASSSTTSFTFREHGTPAKWSQEGEDMPSPFIKRPPMTSTASEQPRPTASAFRMPRSKSGGGIAKLAAIRNAREAELAAANWHYPL